MMLGSLLKTDSLGAAEVFLENTLKDIERHWKVMKERRSEVLKDIERPQSVLMLMWMFCSNESALRYTRHGEARRCLGEVLVQLLDLVKAPGRQGARICYICCVCCTPHCTPPGLQQGGDESSCIWSFAELGVAEMHSTPGVRELNCATSK